jgi:DNA-binding beta-propeller fold protein YncE
MRMDIRILLVGLVAGCGPGDTTGGQDLAMGGDLATPGADLVMPGGDLAMGGKALKRESQSSAIAITDDDKIVAAVSPDDDQLYLIDTTKMNAKVAVALRAGCEPRSVAYSPDRSFWVACRGINQVVQVTDIDASGMVGTPVDVGAEPTAVAVSPLGKKVFVANYADGTVTIYDTGAKSAMTADVGPNPRAVSITNNGDGNESDEIAFVSLMFGQAVGGNVPSEGNDVGREGHLVPVTMDGTANPVIKLSPIGDTTFKVTNKANQQVVVGAYPNQLQAIGLHNGKGYVVSTAASPGGPVNNAGNVHPFVSVFDTAAKTEKLGGPSGANPNTRCGTAIADKTMGYAAGTLDLAIQTRDLNGMTMPPPVLFPTIPVDIALVPQANLDVGYVVSMASDEVVRIVWDYATNTACMGSAAKQAISLQAMAGDIKVPIGMVIRNDATLGYVNSWVGREVEVIDFASQTVSARVALSAQPANDPDKTRQKGKKFFWTSTGRWSKAGWGSCGACHPDGLSDNVTFVFATGPRQTLPLDSDFGKDANGTPDPTDQRILNWSAIFDEIHDFENNTRGVSGGLGAVVSVNGNPIDIVATKDNNLNGSIKQLVADGNTPRPTTNMLTETVDVATGSDWDAIEAYIQALRSQKHPKKLDANDPSVLSGKKLFDTAKCANCHGGAKWTISRRAFTPTQGAGMGSATCSMQTTALAKKMLPNGQNGDQFQLELEHTKTACMVDADCTAANLLGGVCKAGFCAIAPQRVSCVIRNVGTFGGGPQGAAFEVRSDTDANGKGLLAEGASGFNPPSLLSLAETAPYLHNGAAQTLVDLFTNNAFQNHWAAGNVNFAPNATEAKDLANYLLSIDQKTTITPIDGNFDLCTGSFMSNQNACTNP